MSTTGFFISNTQPGNFTADGVYTFEVPPTPAAVPASASDLYAICGGANDGPVNQPTRVTNPTQDGMAVFGNDTTSANSLLRAAISASPECSNFLFNRQTDGTDAAAVITVPCGGAYAASTITVSVLPSVGATVFASLVDGALTVNTAQYVVRAGDTTASVAKGIAAVINASAAVGTTGFLHSATAVSNTVKVEANVAGTAGNSFTVAVTTLTGTITPASPTAMSGGAAGSGNAFILTRKNTGSNANAASAQVQLQSGSFNATPVVSVQINYPNAPAEFWANIPAYASVGGGFDVATLRANIIGRINGTVRGIAGSQRWTASAGSGTQPPTLASTTASGGTSGTSGLTPALLLGTDGTSNRTGAYAFRGQISAGQFALAGVTDPSIVQSALSLASQENAILFYSLPEGTTTEEAIALRQQYVLANPSLILTMDWDNVFDVTSGTQFAVPPQDTIAGIVCSLPAYAYPGNEPASGVTGVLSTDQIINGVNTVAPEAGLRQQNGLLYLSYMPRASKGPQLGLPHGMTSDGVTPISDIRMLKKIAADLMNLFGQVVGDGMNTDPTSPNFLNPAGALMKSLANGYLRNLLAPQLGYPNGVITAYSFQLGANNTQNTAQGGYLYSTTLVTTLSPAQFVINTVQVGRTVQVAISPAQQPAAA